MNVGKLKIGLGDPLEIAQKFDEVIKKCEEEVAEVMSWEKCQGCAFLIEMSRSPYVEYMCAVTREILTLEKCVKDALGVRV